MLHVHRKVEEHDNPVTEHILSAGRLHIKLRARVRKEFDFAQSEGRRVKSILRGRMKISRVKQQHHQQQKMFEKFYSAGREGSNMTCIFNWLWLTETEERQCMSALVLLPIVAKKKETTEGEECHLAAQRQSTDTSCRKINAR